MLFICCYVKFGVVVSWKFFNSGELLFFFVFNWLGLVEYFKVIIVVGCFVLLLSFFVVFKINCEGKFVGVFGVV